MSNSRRDFIKKNLFAGLLLSSGHGSKVFAHNQLNLNFDGFKKGEHIYWKKIKKQFGISGNLHYLNTAGIGCTPKFITEKIYKKVVDLEKKGSAGRSLFEDARNVTSDFFNVSASEVAFTRNTTEGINIAARSLPLQEGDEILLTRHEHIGGSAPWLSLQKDKGVRLKLIELDLTGENNLKILKENITSKTRAVSFSHITCTTGLKLPAKEIVNYCRSKGIYTCIDGAQSAGTMDIDLREINPDFFACSGHKWIHGPKGTGILYINENIIDELNLGYAGAYTYGKYDLAGLSGELVKEAKRVEYGTRNSVDIYGLGQALSFLNFIGIKEVEKREKALADRFREGVKSNNKIKILTPESTLYSGPIVSFTIEGMDYNNVVNELNYNRKIKLRGIYENNLNAIRASFSILNDEKDIDILIESINEISNN